MVFETLLVRAQHMFTQVGSIPAAYPLVHLLDSTRLKSQKASH